MRLLYFEKIIPSSPFFYTGRSYGIRPIPRKKRPALPADLILLSSSAFLRGPCVSLVNVEPHLNLGDKEVLFKMICCVPSHSRKLRSCIISLFAFEIPARADRRCPQASFPQSVRNNTLCASLLDHLYRFCRLIGLLTQAHPFRWLCLHKFPVPCITSRMIIISLSFFIFLITDNP